MNERYIFQVKDVPVFLMHIEDPGFVDKYSLPPNPGLLAYLQRLYHLSFSSMVSALRLNKIY